MGLSASLSKSVGMHLSIGIYAQNLEFVILFILLFFPFRIFPRTQEVPLQLIQVQL
jgi:hypothetical protein